MPTPDFVLALRAKIGHNPLLADLPDLPPLQTRAVALARADEPAWFAL